MSADPTDPSVVHTVAVTVDDAVAAYEATRGRDARTVLRVTRPFSGRMRARLHRVTGDEGTLVHARPGDLFADEAPAYPHPDETEDALRAAPDAAYTRERHRRRHEAAVEEWREAVHDHVVETAPLRAPSDTWTVDVVTLG